MARTKEYDREKALDDAMKLFWTHGYSATSIQQLCNAMDVCRSSMYEEFGNKRDLFVEALGLYSESINLFINAISQAEEPKEAVLNFFDVSFLRQSDSDRYRGCLLVHTIFELRDVDRELSTLAAMYFEEIEEAFIASFQNCAEKGTLEKGRDPAVLAAFIMTLVKGIRVVTRQGFSETYLHGVMDTALSIFQGAV